MPTEATALPGAIERARRKLAGIAIYVFRAKRADRIKLIFWGGTGARLFSKRLEQREVSLAEDRGWRHAPVGGAPLGAARGNGLAARPRGEGDAGAGFARMSRDTLNQGVEVKSGRRSSSKTGGKYGLLRS